MPTDAQTLLNQAVSLGYDRLSERELKECLLAAASSGGAGGGVTSIVAGTNVTISPPSGLGNVTVNASGGSGGGIVGTGPPNGSVVGNVAQNYTDASAQTFWIKETGNATNTGWVQFI